MYLALYHSEGFRLDLNGHILSCAVPADPGMCPADELAQSDLLLDQSTKVTFKNTFFTFIVKPCLLRKAKEHFSISKC